MTSQLIVDGPDEWGQTSPASSETSEPGLIFQTEEGCLRGSTEEVPR
jgi:hypothetical protein